MLQVILLLLYLCFSRFGPCNDSPPRDGLDLRYFRRIDLNCSKTQDNLWVDLVKWFSRTLKSKIARWANRSSRTRARETRLHRKPWLSIRWSILVNDWNKLHRNDTMAVNRWIALRDFRPTWLWDSYVEGRSNFKRTCWYPNHLRRWRVSDGTIRGFIWGWTSYH